MKRISQAMAVVTTALVIVATSPGVAEAARALRESGWGCGGAC